MSKHPGITWKWNRCGAYCITHNQYAITKYIVMGKPIYALWHCNDKIGQFDSADEAKKECKAEKRKMGRAND